MKHSFYYILLLAFAAISCSKWKEPSALVVQDLNLDPYTNPVYKDYLDHLKTYKTSKHSIMLGFVGNWDVTAYSNKLSAIPDSVDMIALLKPPATFTDAQADDFKKVQSQKNTKILFYLNAKTMSDSIQNNPTMFPGGDSAAIVTYIGKVTDQLSKSGYDGLVLNMEGNVCYTCNSVFMSQQKTSYLISLLGKAVGPMSATGKLFMVQGEPKDVGATNGNYFDYFIANTNTSSFYYVEDAAYDLYKQYTNFSNDKFIVTADFTQPADAKAGGISFYTNASGNVQPSSLGLAGWNTADGKKGGLAIYYIENDFGNNFFSYTRGAIGIQNPSVK
jgi:hypothetical protein